MSEKISVLIPEEEIQKRIAEVGAQLSKDYEGEEVLMICILRGGVFFACELAKHLTVPVSMDFMCVSSYGKGMSTSGQVKIIKDLDTTIEGKDVIIVEDILDSGVTLSYLMDLLRARKPASIRLCTLFDKPARHKVDIHIDYKGMEVPNEFIVGYGLDYAEVYRNYPEIAVLKPQVYTED